MVSKMLQFTALEQVPASELVGKVFSMSELCVYSCISYVEQ